MKALFIKALVFFLLLTSFTVVVYSDFSHHEFEEEKIESIVDLAVSEVDDLIYDYIDVDYFINHRQIMPMNVNSLAAPTSINLSEPQLPIASFDDEQYIALADSLTEIFANLSEEEYKVFEELAEENVEVLNLLELIENEFSTDEQSLSCSSLNVKDNFVKISTGISKIGAILTAQKVCNAAVVAIKGAFSAMVATLKAFLIPNTVKATVITASILVIATVVIVNWNKIRPVFSQITDVFVNNAKNLASTVKKVFNNIFSMAVAAGTYNTLDDVIEKDNDIFNELKALGKSPNLVKKIIAEFLGAEDIEEFYQAKNKVLCIGRDVSEEIGIIDDYKYQNYATKHKFWAFWVMNYKSYIDKYGLSFIDLCNEILVVYCCLNDWDFILVTNPYHYMEEHKNFKHGGRGYAAEIKTIRSNGYVRFINTNVTWNTIPYPGNSESDFYKFAGYRISK